MTRTVLRNTELIRTSCIATLPVAMGTMPSKEEEMHEGHIGPREIFRAGLVVAPTRMANHAASREDGRKESKLGGEGEGDKEEGEGDKEEGEGDREEGEGEEEER